MTLDELTKNLCIHDPRNPNWDEDEVKDPKCSCDNCFYGRNRLADYALGLLESLKNMY